VGQLAWNAEEKAARTNQARDLKLILRKLRFCTKAQLNELMKYISPVNREQYSPVCGIDESVGVDKLKTCVSNPRRGRMLHFPGVASGLRDVLETFASADVTSQIRAGNPSSCGDLGLHTIKWIVDQVKNQSSNIAIHGASLMRRSNYKLKTSEQGALTGDSIVQKMENHQKLKPFLKALNPLDGSLIFPNPEETTTFTLYKQTGGRFTSAHLDSIVHPPTGKLLV
jgi:hypothetical protein